MPPIFEAAKRQKELMDSLSRMKWTAQEQPEKMDEEQLVLEGLVISSEESTRSIATPPCLKGESFVNALGRNF